MTDQEGCEVWSSLNRLFVQVSGQVTYNGQLLDTFLPQRTAAYVPQVKILLLAVATWLLLGLLSKCRDPEVMATAADQWLATRQIWVCPTPCLCWQTKANVLRCVACCKAGSALGSQVGLPGTLPLSLWLLCMALFVLLLNFRMVAQPTRDLLKCELRAKMVMCLDSSGQAVFVVASSTRQALENVVLTHLAMT